MRTHGVTFPSHGHRGHRVAKTPKPSIIIDRSLREAGWGPVARAYCSFPWWSGPPPIDMTSWIGRSIGISRTFLHSMRQPVDAGLSRDSLSNAPENEQVCNRVAEALRTVGETLQNHAIAVGLVAGGPLDQRVHSELDCQLGELSVLLDSL